MDTISRSQATDWPLAGNVQANERVLVVDDRPDVRLAFMYMLEACGYRVAEAANGAEALACLAREKIDVVLTDLYMPGMDGLALLRIIRQNPPPRPFVIAMSGSPHLGQSAALEAARVLGADAVLRKPLSREQLVGTIRDLLRTRERQQG